MVQYGAIIHPQEHRDVGRRGHRNAIDLESVIVYPRLFQSHTQAGSASAVVVDEDPRRSSGLHRAKHLQKRFPGVGADLDHCCPLDAPAPLAER